MKACFGCYEIKGYVSFSKGKDGIQYLEYCKVCNSKKKAIKEKRRYYVKKNYDAIFRKQWREEQEAFGERVCLWCLDYKPNYFFDGWKGNQCCDCSKEVRELNRSLLGYLKLNKIRLGLGDEDLRIVRHLSNMLGGHLYPEKKREYKRKARLKYNRNNPEKIKELAKKHRERIKNNPELRAKYNERKRQSYLNKKVEKYGGLESYNYYSSLRGLIISLEKETKKLRKKEI